MKHRPHAGAPFMLMSMTLSSSMASGVLSPGPYGRWLMHEGSGKPDARPESLIWRDFGGRSDAAAFLTPATITRFASRRTSRGWGPAVRGERMNNQRAGATDW